MLNGVPDISGLLPNIREQPNLDLVEVMELVVEARAAFREVQHTFSTCSCVGVVLQEAAVARTLQAEKNG